MGYTISSIIAAIICLTALKLTGLPGMLALFTALMALHIWYRLRYGYWMGDR